MRSNLTQDGSSGRHSSLPPGLLPAAGTLWVLGGIGVNSGLAVLAISVLVIICVLLWRPGESPILLFIVCYQWVQASTAIFHANWYGVPVEETSVFGGEVSLAIILSLCGLVALSVGMRVGAGGWVPESARRSLVMASKGTSEKWLYSYGLAFVIATIAQASAWYVLGLSQLLLAAANLKWVLFYMLAYSTFSGVGGHRLLWASVFFVELVLSFGGYFSDFKTVFFISIMALIASGLRLTRKQLFGGALLAAGVCAVAIVWTSVKKEYRTFVNGGQNVQAVSVTYGSSVGKLMELVGELDHARMSDGLQDLLRRIAYVDFFGVVLVNVPKSVPYEDGALWWDAITRPLMPRLFFPSKTAIHDSERTNQYTGLGVSGVEQGTSVSLGLMAESYIDFGQFGMMIALFCYGAGLGGVYRWMVRSRGSAGLLGGGLTTATLIGAAALESSVTKVVGGLAVGVLLSAVFVYLVVPRYLYWLRV